MQYIALAVMVACVIAAGIIVWRLIREWYKIPPKNSATLLPDEQGLTTSQMLDKCKNALEDWEPGHNKMSDEDRKEQC